MEIRWYWLSGSDASQAAAQYKGRVHKISIFLYISSNIHKKGSYLEHQSYSILERQKAPGMYCVSRK